jgi:hypothetical protein
MSERDENVLIWAVVDAGGNVVGAYTNRVSAARRCDYLDSDERFKQFGPYAMVRCVGSFEVKP